MILGTVGVFSKTAYAADSKTTNGKVEYEAGGTSIDPGDGTLNGGLPTDLNFGKHQIQNAVNETWVATVDGVQASDLTTGKLIVNDNRGTAVGWNVKVKQNGEFKSGTDVLAGTELVITTGTATNAGGTVPTTGAIGSTLSLSPNDEKVIFGAEVAEGEGQSTLPLSKFELNVPTTAKKKATEYSTTLTWTLADTPA